MEAGLAPVEVEGPATALLRSRSSPSTVATYSSSPESSSIGSTKSVSLPGGDGMLAPALGLASPYAT